MEIRSFFSSSLLYSLLVLIESNFALAVVIWINRMNVEEGMNMYGPPVSSKHYRFALIFNNTLYSTQLTSESLYYIPSVRDMTGPV